MRTERKQILALLATRRISAAEAERLLALSGAEERHFAWITVAILAIGVLGRQIPDVGRAVPHQALSASELPAIIHHLSTLLNHSIGGIQ